MRKLYHHCGCAIGLDEGGAFYAAPTTPGAPPIESCPGCGQPLVRADLDYSREQLQALGRIYGRLLAMAHTTPKERPDEM